MTASWTREHLASLEAAEARTRVFGPDETIRMFPDLYLWDLWPVRLDDGSPAVVGGSELWMALSAWSGLEPGQRHDVARIRLIARSGASWHDLGPVFPEGASLGSREWAGCATYTPDAGGLDVYYTASGRAGEASPTFEQRIVHASASLQPGEVLRLVGWSPHREVVTPEGRYRSTSGQDTGEPGFIKAFRDPFRFRDPSDAREYLLFTGSLDGSSTDFDGVIGIAGRDRDGVFTLAEPLLEADGVNNELERPHVVVHDGVYYLFFSTQARTFHPDVTGPTGLYSFFAPSMAGPWQPVNGSGLVLCNPAEEPYQAYSWLVLDDLTVASFIDFHSLGGLRPEEVEAEGQGRAHFGGTLAPPEHITLDGANARLVPRA